MSQLTIIAKELSLLHTNCYFICNNQTNEAVIIDPADNADLIRDICDKNCLRPVAVLLTHGHFDHVMAAADIRKAYTVSIYAGLAEKTLLSDATLNVAAMLRKRVTLSADQWLQGGDILDIAGFQIEVIATPGHTPGSVCYYIKNENVLFSGDTLFKEGFGRTDFPLGNAKQIYCSITQKLFTLPDDTTVYPGHGAKTTIAYEKQSNMIYTLCET